MQQEKMTQTDLAERIGVSCPSISRFVHEARSPRIDILVKIASVFNVSIEYLLGLKEVDDFNEIKGIVARNSKNMTDEQKMELVKILLKN